MSIITQLKWIDGKYPTGKAEDLFICISLSAAPSLELSVIPGYRKSLLFSFTEARTSPSRRHTQTASRANTYRSFRDRISAVISYRTQCAPTESYLEAPSEWAQNMLCQLRGKRGCLDGERMINVTAYTLKACIVEEVGLKYVEANLR